MNLPEKPKEVASTPSTPEILPDINIPTPKTKPEHPAKIVPEELPDKNFPLEVDPENNA